ncbi:MAG: synthase subunit delta [Ignavibacteria bacterium]|nr:synthase subunit delta [Ignavibacteria bacterium]
MFEQKVSSRYAQAVLSTAISTGFADRVFDDFIIIRDTIKSSREFYTFLKSPIIRFWQKKKVFQEVFSSSVSELTLNFIILLADKHRESLLPSIIAQYQAQYNAENNRLPVEISSAVALSDDLKKKIMTRLEGYTKKTVLPEYSIDKKLKGGITVRIDDWVFDGSIKNQLEILFKKLSEGKEI